MKIFIPKNGNLNRRVFVKCPEYLLDNLKYLTIFIIFYFLFPLYGDNIFSYSQKAYNTMSIQ